MLDEAAARQGDFLVRKFSGFIVAQSSFLCHSQRVSGRLMANRTVKKLLAKKYPKFLAAFPSSVWKQIPQNTFRIESNVRLLLGR